MMDLSKAMKVMIGFIGVLILLAPLTVFAQNKVVVIPLFGDDPKPTIPAPVPKTGQTQSYGDRDDGDLQRGVAWPDPRFTDNGNGTVTDNLTGLVWLKNGNCIQFFSGDSTGKNDRTWAGALTAANNLANGYCGLSDGSVAGDWHLPNLRELQSLIDYRKFIIALPDDHPFTNTVSSWYWSSNTYADWASDAWRVLFLDGQVSYVAKSSSSYVRAVRAGKQVLGEFDSLIIYIDPQNALLAGAQWIIQGTATQYYSGETVRNIPIGRYTIEFKVVPGWRPERTITVTVQANKTTTATGFYLEQAGIMPEVMMLLLDEEE